jgi:arginine exporter protein ArgO
MHGRPTLALLLVAGVVAGSAAWWLMLSAGVSLLRSRFDARAMRWVNRVSAAVIGAFGLAALGTALAEGGR